MFLILDKSPYCLYHYFVRLCGLLSAAVTDRVSPKCTTVDDVRDLMFRAPEGEPHKMASAGEAGFTLPYPFAEKMLRYREHLGRSSVQPCEAFVFVRFFRTPATKIIQNSAIAVSIVLSEL